jgi:hypothetical protein
MLDGRCVSRLHGSIVLRRDTDVMQVVGFRKFAMDDVFAFVSMLLWTGEAVSIYFLGKLTQCGPQIDGSSDTSRPGFFGTYVGLTEETAEALDDKTIASYTKGSKALLSAWLCYATLIWSMKVVSLYHPYPRIAFPLTLSNKTVLFFYQRLTARLSQQKLVKFLGIAVGVTYIIVLLEILLHCRPIQRHWQIKPYAGGTSKLAR